MIDPDTPAPGFTLPSDTGGDVTLADFRGRKVILYFYPRDNTPGCTVQACDFRDSLPGFEGAGVAVLGVSADSIESHRRFRKLFSLNFPLLADQDHTVSRAYGVWKKHKVFGMNIERSTFLIDEAGNIERIWRNVRPGGHTKMLSELVDGGPSNHASNIRDT
jgi:peroxiredoxin Q/BCP